MNVLVHKDYATFGKQILDELKAQRSKTTSQTQQTNELILAAKEAAIESTIAFRHNYTLVLADFWKNVLQCEVELTTSNNEYQRAYEIYVILPIPSFTGRMAVQATLSMRRAWGFLPNISVLCGGLNFVNIIPIDSKIVAACRRGDVVAVQTLFSEKKAAPNDMTTERETLVGVSASHTCLVQTSLTGTRLPSRADLRD